MEWLPQNDLLAHPNIKAFLTHGGINSVYEVRTSTVSLLVAEFRTLPLFTLWHGSTPLRPPPPPLSLWLSFFQSLSLIR